MGNVTLDGKVIEDIRGRSAMEIATSWLATAKIDGVSYFWTVKTWESGVL